MKFDQHVTLQNRVKSSLEIFTLKSFIFTILPFTQTLYDYRIKKYLINDLFAGLTSGIMHIPQGLSYAIIANVKPMNGLYTSLFSSIIYFIFGASKHLSVGPIAIVSLFTGEFVQNTFNKMIQDNSTTSYYPNQSDDFIKEKLSVILALTVGVIQFLLGLFRVGFITKYLSDSMLSGFTIGATIIVAINQIKTAAGFELPKRIGYFSPIFTVYDMLTNLNKINWFSSVISLTSFAILILFKFLINPIVMKHIKAPIPIELIIITSGSLLSKKFNFSENYNVKIIGSIKNEVFSFEKPDLRLVSLSLKSGLITAIVAMSISYSLANFTAQKFSYQVNFNQELRAHGFMNMFGSFFHCYPASGSLSRTALQASLNSHSQLSSIFAALVVLVSILFLSSFFEHIPMSFLSTIILAALLTILMQIAEGKILWRANRADFYVWIGALLSTVVLSVEMGLLIGTFLSFISIINRAGSHKLIRYSYNSEMKAVKMVCNDNDESFQDERGYIHLFKLEGSLYFVSINDFQQRLYSAIRINPNDVSLKMRNLKKRINKVSSNKSTKLIGIQGINGEMKIKTEKGSSIEERLKTLFNCSSDNDEAKLEKLQTKLKKTKREVYSNRAILLDMSAVNFVDFMGAVNMIKIIKDLKSLRINLYLCGLIYGVEESLQKAGALSINSRQEEYTRLDFLTAIDKLIQTDISDEDTDVDDSSVECIQVHLNDQNS